MAVADELVSDGVLAAWVADARARSIELVRDLAGERLSVPYLPTINPPVWELCHLTYFAELWVLRRGAGQEPEHPHADRLFDSISIAHEPRWTLPLPDLERAVGYAESVCDRVLARIDAGLDDPRLRYLVLYSIFHEDMHAEALTTTRQTLGYPAPNLDVRRTEPPPGGDRLGDVSVPGGELHLGARRDVAFCFDNEKWAHRVTLQPFEIACATVTEGDFAAFVLDGGYRRRELWDHAGQAWRAGAGAELPLYWRRAGRDAFEVREFDVWRSLDATRAMCHVSAHEAEAWCRWAGRRLPTEVEWEAAAKGCDEARTYPWGEELPDPARAAVDWASGGPVDATAFPEGTSAAGCRQMAGNVWEWTSSLLTPWPDFEPDMYADYSRPFFGVRRVLRGGCWATRGRLCRNTFRNFYQPSRRDMYAGFRTCAP